MLALNYMETFMNTFASYSKLFMLLEYILSNYASKGKIFPKLL